MSRTSRVRALVSTLLLAAAGCQDYNFNPVGECLIQPGTRRVKLSDVTTADVLFVIDDSGSMGGEQAQLSANFSKFIDNLNQTNLTRVAAGLVPIDFHLAVTTTSVFENLPDASSPVCASDCPQAKSSGPICCDTSAGSPVTPQHAVRTCSGPSDTSCPTGYSCRSDCISLLGDYACCDASKVPVRDQEIPCATVGAACGDLATHYRPTSDPACSALAGTRYPQGDFLASGTNPKVLHFDKKIYAPAAGDPCTPGVTCTNDDGVAATALLDGFKQNVLVGTCGSNEEQGFEAARRAVEFWMTQPESTREWLHPSSKLVLVFVGDEDDCSSKEDASAGIILTGVPGADSCAADAALPADEQRLTSSDAFTHYFTTVRPDQPLGAAFIVSARSGAADTCVDEACTPAICCGACGAGVCTTDVCGGQAPGARFLEGAGELRANGADVVAGSICDPDFGSILGRIAEIVKPPSGLLLPTQPAAEEVTVLRIAGLDGKTRQTCRGPAPAGTTAADAAAAGYDWWFTLTREQLTDAQKQPTSVSRYVYINHDTRNCEASPGETYAADYIGRLPANGCTGTGTTPDEARQAADDNCVAMLGGRTGDWTCFAGTDSAGVCTVPTDGVVGTCLCGPRYVPPPDGSPAGTPGTGICPLN